MQNKDYNDDEKKAYAEGIKKGKKLAVKNMASVLMESDDMKPSSIAKVILAMTEEETSGI